MNIISNKTFKICCSKDNIFIDNFCIIYPNFINFNDTLVNSKILETHLVLIKKSK